MAPFLSVLLPCCTGFHAFTHMLIPSSAPLWERLGTKQLGLPSGASSLGGGRRGEGAEKEGEEA